MDEVSPAHELLLLPRWMIQPRTMNEEKIIKQKVNRYTATQWSRNSFAEAGHCLECFVIDCEAVNLSDRKGDLYWVVFHKDEYRRMQKDSKNSRPHQPVGMHIHPTAKGAEADQIKH